MLITIDRIVMVTRSLQIDELKETERNTSLITSQSIRQTKTFQEKAGAGISSLLDPNCHLRNPQYITIIQSQTNQPEKGNYRALS